MASLYMINLFYVLMKNKEIPDKILKKFLHSFPTFHKFSLTLYFPSDIIVWYRGVAQFGRALRSGRRGRGFESRRLD